MTQFCFRQHKTETWVFTDRLAATFKGEKKEKYKPHIIEDKGVIIFGRGMETIFENLAGYIRESEAKNFDEIVPIFSDLVRESLYDFFLDVTDAQIPDGWTLDEAIEDCKKFDNSTFKAFNADVICVGYSEENQSMGCAICWTYRDFEVQATCKPLIFFMNNELAAKKAKEKFQRPPGIPEEIVSIMREIYKHEVKKEKHYPEILGGGNVDMTILKPDGSYEIKDMGPLKPNMKAIKSGKGPGRNSPCPCGSGKKYKKCCEKG